MLGYTISVVIGIIAYGLRAWGRRFEFETPPDALSYFAMARGRAVPDPFRLRWMIPFLMRTDKRIPWALMNGISLILTCPLIYWFAEIHGVNPLISVALWVALPLWDILSRLIGMIDQPALLIALLAACLHGEGLHYWAYGVGFLGASIAPKTVIFLVLWMLDPVFLIGLVPVGVAYLFSPRGEPLIHGEAIRKPWRSSMLKNSPHLHNMKELLLPWGACLVAFHEFPLQYVPLILISYSQLLRALDRSRLYMWAAPILIILAVAQIPEAFFIPAFLISWFNPFRPSV